MSTLTSLNLKSVYRTGKDDLYNDFYIPCLSISCSYDRAVGYFSSEILAMSLKGLSHLIRTDGSMRLIIGHPLSPQEFDAVKHGILLKDMVDDLSSQLENIIEDAKGSTKRLELLSWLIACGKLEIKFALRRAGMYHEKIGIFRDIEKNIIVFQGSANETPHGMLSALNAESISVYKSWEEHVFSSYGQEFIDGFERLWRNDEVNTITLDIPSATYERIANNVKNNAIDLDGLKDLEDEIEACEKGLGTIQPFIPLKIGNKKFTIFDHQREALGSWKSNSFKGILQLATGSGKTIMSIYGAVKIFDAKLAKKQQLFLIVAVPYVELAIQWVANLKLFGIIPEECFDSKSSWAEAFESQVNYFKAGVTNFSAAVVVNRTLTSPLFQKLINEIDSNSLMIIGDECHNHGSKNINAALPNAYYRMGLSATPFRNDDDEVDSPFPNDSKERLISYYGEIVSTYGLDDAIHDEVLTPYKYHIIPIYLTLEEQEEYETLSSKISNIILKQKSTGLNAQDRESLTRYCGQRSRLLGGAKNKLEKLKAVTLGISDDEKKYTLFYAGEGKPYGDPDNDDIKIIDQVSTVLNENGWKCSQFTGAVSKSERKILMSAFKDKTIDALVAMKVLDEGIDVPACKTAYILASTKNPRQYIQRRGRILRKSENKHIATIFDFVVLPINDSSASKRLKLSEAERVNDFALLAVNKIEIEQIIMENGLSYDVT